MSKPKSTAEEPTQGGGGILAHLVATIAGVVLMIVGLGMGVILVMLPLGIVLGPAGLFVFLWGIFGRGRSS